MYSRTAFSRDYKQSKFTKSDKIQESVEKHDPVWKMLFAVHEFLGGGIAL